jgi:hypothetical protein
MTAAIDRVLTALDQAGKKPRQTGANTWRASCPGPLHDQGNVKNPALWITYEDGTVGLHCHSGCTEGPKGDPQKLEPVLTPLGLSVGDLRDEPRENGQRQHTQSEPERPCLGRYKTHLFGTVGSDPDHPQPGDLWNVWFTESGERAWKVRVPCKRDGCDGRTFAWRQAVLGAVVEGKPSNLLPYRFPELRDVMGDGWRGTVLICEGESDTDAARKHGARAITAGQALAWDPRYTELLVELGVTEAKIAADRDTSGLGRKHAEKIKTELQAAGIQCQIVEARAGKDIREHLERGYTLFDLVQVDQAEPSGPERQQEDDIRLLLPRIDWYELWADDSDEEWILYPLIPARRGIAMFTPAKIGKSLLMLEVAVGISRGTKVLGHTPSRRYRVLYVDFENDPRGDIRTRLQDMGYEPDDLDHLDYLSFPALTDLDSEAGGVRLMAAVKAYGSEVVVIDTISRAVEGEENSNDTWLDFYRHTGMRLRQAEVAMARLDHTGKDQTKGQRGGSAKYGDVDAVWKLTEVVKEQRYRLECTDVRFPLDTKSLSLVRLADPLRHEVENLSAATVRETKIAHIVKAADEAGLPADMSVRDLREWGKGCGIKARNDVWAEAVRQRTLTNPENFLFPSQEASETLETSEKRSPGSGEQHSDIPDSEREKRSPDPRVTAGNTTPGVLFPVPPSIGGEQGNAGITVFDLFVRAYNQRGLRSRTLFDLLGGEPMLQRLKNYNPN